jgi:hypothetical protein
MRYNVGDRVWVVNNLSRTYVGEMNDLIGTIVQISSIIDCNYKIKEDDEEWVYDESMFKRFPPRLDPSTVTLKGGDTINLCASFSDSIVESRFRVIIGNSYQFSLSGEAANSILSLKDTREVLKVKDAMLRLSSHSDVDLSEKFFDFASKLILLGWKINVVREE